MPAGRDAGVAAAQAHLRRRAQALSARPARRASRARSRTSSRVIAAARSTRPTSSPSPTSSHWARDAEASSARAAAAPPTRWSATACGVTEVDPRRATLLFGRFISVERNEPPDIDIDFEHQRREEVIQYIYGKYGRHRAALTAVVISYRPRSALRDVGRALGIDLQRIEAVVEEPALVRRPRHRARAAARERLRSRVAGRAAVDGAHRAADRLSAPPVAAPGRLRHRARAGWPSWCRSRTRRWRTAASSSGTRTTSTRSAC